MWPDTLSSHQMAQSGSQEASAYGYTAKGIRAISFHDNPIELADDRFNSICFGSSCGDNVDHPFLERNPNWYASAAICLFSARVLSTQTGNLKIKPFLLVSGLLALILGLDDAFLLHEEVIPRFLGVPEEAVYVIYVGFVLFYLVIFYPVIRKTEYVLLIMAFVFFGVSVSLDFFEPPGIDPFLFEDAAKLVGLVSWLAYFFRTSALSLFDNVVQQDDE